MGVDFSLRYSIFELTHFKSSYLMYHVFRIVKFCEAWLIALSAVWQNKQVAAVAVQIMVCGPVHK